MSDYIDILDAEIAAGRPITTGLLARYRDNMPAFAEGALGAPQFTESAFDTGVVTATKILDDSVSIGKIGANEVKEQHLASGAVTQRNLDVATESGSVLLAAGAAEPYTLDHQFGFFPQFAINTDTQSFSAFIHGLQTSGGHTSTVAYHNTFVVRNDGAGSATIGHRYLYITASPPYDLGDGNVNGFLFAQFEDGTLKRTNLRNDPPWAFTGRRGKQYQMQAGEQKFEAVRKAPMSLSDAKKSGNVREYAQALRGAQWEPRPVTPRTKNERMAERPHPFRPGAPVVIVDPMSEIIIELQRMIDDGEDALFLLHEGYIHIDNEPLKRAAPPGVIPVAAKWRNTRQ